MAIGTSEQPLRVAIVGSGPAGFYAAGHLLKCKSHPDLCVQVDMFDRLPTPWGLVRAGVAPDHPNIKAVSRVYEKTAEHPEFRFYGNVELGRDLSHEELTERYHAVIYAVGAQTDRRMGIPGEDLPGSWAATEFVAWYNGHPDYRDPEFDLSAERAIVVGNGNVATDVARMLALTRDELAATDVADHALEVLAESNVTRDRRARPARPRAGRVHEPGAAGAGRDDRRRRVRRPRRRRARPALEGLHRERGGARHQRKNVDILTGYAAREPLGKRRRIVLRFLVSPVEILGERARGGHPLRAQRARGGRRRLDPPARHGRDGGARLRPRVPLDRLPRHPHPGRSLRRGALRHPERGRPHRRDRTGEYAVGWIKRGPTGIIGTNKRDAQETVDTLLADLDAGQAAAPSRPGPRLDRRADRRAPARRVSYAGWQAVDRVEREAGEPHGRPRVKLCTFEELLEAAKAATPAP